MQLESITMPDRITWNQFGCRSSAYYEEHIRGKRLPVKMIYGKYFLVETSDGQQWNVHEDDLITDEEYRGLKVMEAVEFEWRKQQREENKQQEKEAA